MINLDKTSISLNKNNLNRTIFSAHINFNASAAQIQNHLMHSLNLTFEQAPSTRYIEKVINDPKTLKIAQLALDKIDQLLVPNVQNIAGDELCSHPNYIFYTSCVPYSGYTLNLDAFDDHNRAKKAVWDACYQPLKNIGLNPSTTTSDQAMGTMSGHIHAFENATHIADFFHLYQNFKDLLKKAKSEQAKPSKLNSIKHGRNSMILEPATTMLKKIKPYPTPIGSPITTKMTRRSLTMAFIMTPPVSPSPLTYTKNISKLIKTLKPWGRLPKTLKPF